MLCGKMPQFGTIDLPKIRENPARIISIPNPQETVALGLAYSGLHLQLSAATNKGADDTIKTTEDLQGVLKAIKNQKQNQQGKSNSEAFVLKFDSAKEAFYIMQETVIIGTVISGCVEVDDWVYLCGGPGQSKRAQVKNIALPLEKKNVTKAQTGDYVAVALRGVSVAEANKGTCIADKPDDPVEPSVDPVMQYSDSKETKGTWVKDAAQKAAEMAAQKAAEMAARQAEEKKRQEKLEETRRRAAAIMQIDPERIPYTPENEFEIGNVGRKDCSTATTK